MSDELPIGTAQPEQGAGAGIGPDAAPEPRKGPGRPKGCKCPGACPVHPEKTPQKPKRDPAPRRPKPSAGSTPKKAAPTSAELEASLAELLTLPAIPAATILKCQFCTHHFVTEGPSTARELVRLSEDNPAFRRMLTRVHEAVSVVTYGTVLAGYVGKPLMHHLAPAQMLEQVGPLVKVPPRPPKDPDAEAAKAAKRTRRTQGAAAPDAAVSAH